MVLYFLGTAFTIWMAVETVRRGQTMPWLCICLIFGPIGSAVYFFTQYLGQVLPARTAPGPKVNLKVLQANAERLDKAELWTDLAVELHERRKAGQAAEAAARALEKDPEQIKARFILGQVQLHSGEIEAARQSLEKVVEADEHFALGEALYALAESQRKAGDEKAALASLERLAQRSSRPQFLYGLAELQWRHDQREASRATLETILEDANHMPRYARAEAAPWVRKAKKALAKLA